MARTIRSATDADLPAIRALLPAGMTMTHTPSAIFIAEEDEQIVGGIGLDWSTGFVKAGPLLLAPGHEHKKWLVLRLIEFLEAFLANSGVTRYTFITPENNLAFRRVAEKAGAQPYAVVPGGICYSREVNSYGRS